MIKKLLLLGAMAIMMFAFTGCEQSDDTEIAVTEAEQSGDVDVELTEVGTDSVKVIKVVRQTTGLGLKEAKDLVDAAPSIVMEDTSKEQEEEFKAALEAVGATVTLK